LTCTDIRTKNKKSRNKTGGAERSTRMVAHFRPKGGNGRVHAPFGGGENGGRRMANRSRKNIGGSAKFARGAVVGSDAAGHDFKRKKNCRRK